jgi:hypothetical protein
MKKTMRVMAAVAVLLVAGGMFAQAPVPTPSFSLKLDVTPTSARKGSELLMVVDLTNNRPEEMVMLVELGTSVQDNFAIHVRDSRGNSVPGPKPLPYDETAYVGISRGETMKFQGDLSRMFDLSRPDRYEIQVERLDPQTNTTVRSNVSHIVVSAQ